MANELSKGDLYSYLRQKEYETFETSIASVNSVIENQPIYDAMVAKEGDYDDVVAKSIGYDTWKAKETAYDSFKAKEAGYDTWKAKETAYDSFKAKESGYDTWKAKETAYDSFKAKEAGYDTWKAKEAGYDTFKAKETSVDTLISNNTTDSNSGELTLDSATVAWTGTTAPSGTLNYSYNWMRKNGWIFLNITLKAGTQGVGITTVVVTLPSGVPAPHVMAGMTGASSILYNGNGRMSSGKTVIGTVSTSYLRRNAADDGFEIVLTVASTSTLVTFITIVYPV